MRWTEEQRRAIEARGSNILLSAAAGSGKTTVLVERVLGLIESGADVDRMLIVTFTRAASADMRAKLSKELGERAASGDARCRNQQLLLERASISTLHGFCSDFLRAHFESAGVDPAFRVLDDAEVRRLRDESLDAAVEEAYAAGEAANAAGARADAALTASTGDGATPDAAGASPANAGDAATPDAASKAGYASSANADSGAGIGATGEAGRAASTKAYGTLAANADDVGSPLDAASGASRLSSANAASGESRLSFANADGGAGISSAGEACRAADTKAYGPSAANADDVGSPLDAASGASRLSSANAASGESRLSSTNADGGAEISSAGEACRAASTKAYGALAANADDAGSPLDAANGESRLSFANVTNGENRLSSANAASGESRLSFANAASRESLSSFANAASRESRSSSSSADDNGEFRSVGAVSSVQPSSPERFRWGGDFAASLSALDYARGPKDVRAMAEMLMGYLEERPDPDAWLARACEPDAATREAWLGELVSAARREIERALLLTRQAASSPDCNNYFPALERDIEELTGMAKLEDFDELRRVLENFKQSSPPRARKGEPVAGDEVKKLRTDARKALDGIALRQVELATALADAEKLAPELRALGEIAKRARELFEERKAELAGLSYADLEHRTLEALSDPAVAAELRERYEYVFVDEYQDTSDVQEALISRIARGDNLFMVGDVKQSIYRFRQAEPKLFLDKYARYGRGEGGLLLPLTMNFRSRPAILNFVNRVFERAMRGGDSEVLYDELARLNHGNAELDGGSVELHLLEAPDESADEELQELAACEREALFIAERIRSMMMENPALRFRDFAILTRNKRGVLGKMATALLQRGIPAFADGSEAFYDSVEILLALSLLKLTANRRSDVELIGVLRSPAVGLTLEELAEIRAARSDVPFVDACAAWAEGSGETANRLREFFDQLERWRLLSLCVDLGALTRTILDESGLYDCMGALPGGPQRQANLDRLADNAAQFDKNVSGSLTRFLKHTEKLQARGDGDEAHLLGEGDDVVRLMTAHKSKGLEFPVVFGAMLSHRYNRRASAAALSAHRDLGLGCLYCDPALQTRRRTLPQLAIAERERREDAAEELRVLYVLLTRARDRLVLVGSVKDAEAAWVKWEAMRDTPGAASCYLDVILPALARDGGGLCEIFVHKICAAPEARTEPEALPEPAPDPELLRALRWRYPEPDAARRPLKLTVTGLLRELQAPDAPEELIERPAFLTEAPGGMTGAERGTAYHRAMQLLDLAALRELAGRKLSEAISAQLDGFAEAGRLQPAQREAVRDSSVARFLESALGQRLLRARDVRREWSFNARLPIAQALSPEEAGPFGEGEILVQGAIDCCFMEDGRWILLDYKTDRSDDAAALTLRYRNQLRLYAAALERVTKASVAEIYLCLLRGGETLPISRSEPAADSSRN